MAILPILTGENNPILRAPTLRIAKVTKNVLKILKDMEETTVASNGLGIAGPQVGQSLRICVVKIGNRFLPLVNPDIAWRSAEQSIAEEGCLSLPGIWLEVPRSVEIAVRYLDGKGRGQERRLKDLDARVVQHEVDHLDGKLIVDYPTLIKRELKLQKPSPNGRGRANQIASEGEEIRTLHPEHKHSF